MLKHSLSHYGTTGGVSLPTPHPLTSLTHTHSSHSGDGTNSFLRDRDREHASHLQQHEHQRQLHQHQQSFSDPTRYLEGHISPTHAHTHSHNHSQSYLDQSYPSLHNQNSLSQQRLYLDSSRTPRGQGQAQAHRHPHQSHHATPTSPQPKQNGIHGSNIFFASPPPPPKIQPLQSLTNYQDLTGPTPAHHSTHHTHPGVGSTFRHGVLRSLSLLSVLSLLLALNSLLFLLKIVWPLNMSGGGSESEFKLMYEVTLCLAAMCLSISLCVLLITSAQYFFAISGSPGTTSFLYKVRLIRAGATGGFFLSIPLFLAAIVLYTFTHLSYKVPAFVTAGIVGLGIIFGGCAMVYHVFTWQKVVGGITLGLAAYQYQRIAKEQFFLAMIIIVLLVSILWICFSIVNLVKESPVLTKLDIGLHLIGGFLLLTSASIWIWSVFQFEIATANSPYCKNLREKKSLIQCLNFKLPVRLAAGILGLGNGLLYMVLGGLLFKA